MESITHEYKSSTINILDLHNILVPLTVYISMSMYHLQEFYKAASVRNPVVDMAGRDHPLYSRFLMCVSSLSVGMRVTSDIPDW